MSFNIGSAAPAGGFSFGSTPASGTGAQPPAFSFGAKTSAPAAPAAGGFNFGAAPAAPAAAPAFSGFSLGSASGLAPAPAAPAASAGFSLGGTSILSGGFNAGTSSAAAGTTPAPSFSIGTAAAPALSAPAAVSAAPAPALSFGTGAQSAAPTFNLAAKSTPAPAPAAATATSGLSLGSALGSSAPSSSAPSFSFAAGASASASTAATTTSTALPSLGSVAPTAAQPAKTSTATGLTAPVSSVTAPAKQMSYKELEDTVDKWLHELGEQEKAFLSQASQVNTWDRQLIENGEKVTEMNNEVEKVKADQQRLDTELDFILSQQEELEELITPIEAQIKSHQLVQHVHHSDVERERTYNLADNIDAQLKRMMEDLREIIERINNSNVNPNPVDETMSHIGKILNSHMDSLQWVDQNTNQLQKRMEDVNKLIRVQEGSHRSNFPFLAS